MDPNVFFSMKDNPGYEVGQGKRGLRTAEEIYDWDEMKVKLKCLNPTCGAAEEILKTSWLENIPTHCSICNSEMLGHEYVVPNAFTKEMIKKYKPDGSFDTTEDIITEPFRRACIVRFVKVKTQS